MPKFHSFCSSTLCATPTPPRPRLSRRNMLYPSSWSSLSPKFSSSQVSVRAIISKSSINKRVCRSCILQRMLRTFSNKHLIQSLDERALIWRVSDSVLARRRYHWSSRIIGRVGGSKKKSEELKGQWSTVNSIAEPLFIRRALINICCQIHSDALQMNPFITSVAHGAFLIRAHKHRTGTSKQTCESNFGNSSSGQSRYTRYQDLGWIPRHHWLQSLLRWN